MAMVNQLERPRAPIGSREFETNPYPTYAHFRSQGPVHRDEAAPIWHVVSYREVHVALRDPRLAAARTSLFLSEEQRQDFGALARILPDMMVFADQPRHTRLRGLVIKAFTPRVVEGLRGRVQAIVDDRLARATQAGTLDVIADLAVPLPTTIIAELLGVPEADRDSLKAWSDDFAAFIGGPVDHDGVVRADGAIRELITYFDRAVTRWRREPGDNLISRLIVAEEQGNTLTADELLATCVILLVGGHETTTNLIGNGLLALLRHPDQLQRLRNDPALIGQAIEELLRYDSPAQMTTRLAVDDLTLGGAHIGKGELIKLWLGAANRDPEEFSEPDRLDLGRAKNRHLSFGHGIHFCVGASLARLEGQVALATLVARFPNLQLTGEPLEYHGTQVFRALKRLPVTL
jgi:cytochrome P450